MSDLDVAVSSFWQLARHWKSGGKAKLELACEDGSLHMQLSAVLGHPDQPHFPHPPPHHPSHPPPSHPIPKKKKSPSQLRRQERRRKEALAKAVEASANRNIIVEEHKSEISIDVSTENLSDVNEAEIIIETEVETTAEPLCLLLKCDQCEYTNATEKGLSQHKRMKHRISQIDGMDDYTEEEVINKVQTEELLCEKCSIIFYTNDHLRQHIKCKHSLGPKCKYHSYHFGVLSYHEKCKEEPEECCLEIP